MQQHSETWLSQFTIESHPLKASFSFQYYELYCAHCSAFRAEISTIYSHRIAVPEHNAKLTRHLKFIVPCDDKSCAESRKKQHHAIIDVLEAHSQWGDCMRKNKFIHSFMFISHPISMLSLDNYYCASLFGANLFSSPPHLHQTPSLHLRLPIVLVQCCTWQFRFCSRFSHFTSSSS